jgi:DNA repair exonuclease SbcCD nuclease subunit
MKLIFTSDWHVRKDIPVCRKDDFLFLQKSTLTKIANIAFDNEAIIIHAGDIFHKAKPMYAQELEVMLYEIFKHNEIYFIAGNHDLLNHSVDNFDKGSIGVINKFENWNSAIFKKVFGWMNIQFYDFGEELQNINIIPNKLNGAVLHKYCEIGNIPKYITDGITAKSLLENYDYDVFVVGDNHKSFVYEKEGRFVFNCGCITRQNANEKFYKPKVYLFDIETKSYEIIELLDNDVEAVSTEHLDKIKVKNNRIDKFIEKMKSEDVKLEVSFEKNLENYMNKNKTDKFVKEKVLNSLEEK